MRRPFVIVLALLLIIAAVVWQTLKSQSHDQEEKGSYTEETLNNETNQSVKVVTLEERDEKTNSVSNISYPKFGQDKIDARLALISDDFLTRYKNAVTGLADIQVSYGADYVQKFEITFIKDQLTIVSLEQYASEGGGTGTDELKTFIFNSHTQEEITPAQLFKDEKYLDVLSKLSREKLLANFEKSLVDTDFSDSTPTAKEEFIDFSKKMITDGTEPLATNFSSLTLNEQGSLIIHFDKYQVAPGASGLVTLEIPYQEISSNFSDFINQIFTPKQPTNKEKESVKKPRLSHEPSAQTKDDTSKTDCQKHACVALTFDDGPSIHTDKLLDILKEKGAHATFFVLGKSAKYQTQTIKRMAQEGHEIESHTFRHRDLRKLNQDEIATELRETDEILEKIIGRRSQFLRPPYGAVSDSVKSDVKRPLILWSVDPLDWKDRNTDLIIERMSTAKVGAIILGHDIYDTTIEAIGPVIDNLRKKGYQLVTVEELLSGHDLKAGQIYRHQ